MSLTIGEPKNSFKLLELGKEITQDVIDRWEDTHCVYVHLKDIKDETLVSIAKKVYKNQKVFLDYIRESYNEEGFEWTDEVLQSFDTMSEIVWCEIVESGEYFYNDEAELFFLLTPLEETLKGENLKDKLSKINKLNPLTMMLNAEIKEYISIRLSDDEKEYIVDTNSQATHLVECVNGSGYKISNPDEFRMLIMDLLEIADYYNNLYTNWTDLETAEHFWYYIKDSYEFDNISKELDKKELNEKLLNSIVEIMNRKEFFEQNMESVLENIKQELSRYHNGEIDAMELYYSELKEIVWQAVKESFSEDFIADDDYVWRVLDNTEKFKLKIEKRLNELENINSFNLKNVLVKEVEYDILLRFIRNDVKDYIQKEYDTSIVAEEVNYFGNEAEKNIGLFFGMGSLKNLTKEECELIYSNTLEYKSEESIKEMTIRYLREYFMNVLLPVNDIDNKFDLIALYHIILEDMHKIKPYVDTMIQNGFTIEDFESKVKNIKLIDSSIKSDMSARFKSIFNNYINKSNPTVDMAPSIAMDIPEYNHFSDLLI